jgi:hypothetical protein
MLGFMIILSSPNVGAQETMGYDVSFDGNLQFEMIFSSKFIDTPAYDLRFEIDKFENIGNDDGFIDQVEIDAYESEFAHEAFNEMRYYAVDNTSASVLEWSMELSGVGADRHSYAPLYKNLSAKAIWPYVDINASNHKFIKHSSGYPAFIKIHFHKNWEITEYTGINNSKLSDDKRTVEGYEFPGYLVVVEFKKVPKETDSGWFLPGFVPVDTILALSILSIIYYYNRSKSSF